MATRRYSIAPGDAPFNVVEAVGLSTATKAIELTVDLAVLTDASDKGRTAVLVALKQLKQYILQGKWPPA